MKDLRSDTRCNNSSTWHYPSFQYRVHRFSGRKVKKFRLTPNIRVASLNNLSAEDLSNGLISLPSKFCDFVSTQGRTHQQMLSNIIANYKDRNWLNERAIFGVKNKNLDLTIQNQIFPPLYFFKFTECITTYSTEILNLLDVSGLPCHHAIYNGGHYASKFNQPKLWQCDSHGDTQRQVFFLVSMNPISNSLLRSINRKIIPRLFVG